MKFHFESGEAVGFSSLSVVREYAQSIQEYPSSDNENFYHPDFTSLYEKERHSHLGKVWNKILIKLGLRAKPIWSVKVWANLLQELTIKRENDQYIGDFILKLMAKDKSRFIIWGDLNGAFHSLVRDCLELNRQGILSEELIISSDYYFIFNGNLIERGPYNLATLTLVMQLIKNNPNKVFYIKGKLEDNKEWHNYALKNELKALASEFSSERIPFESLLNRFFNTLPLVVYLHTQNECLAISNFSGHKMELYESRCIEFLRKKSSNEIEIFHIEDKKLKKVEDYVLYTLIKAHIISVDRTLGSRPTDGLELLIPEKGISSWSILSSPIETYQKIYSFYNDAFVILTITEDIYFWELELNYQDIHEINGFKQKKYNLISGQIIEPSKKIKEKLPDIIIGSTLDLSKSASSVGIKIREGLGLGMTKENLSGGILDRLFKIIILDDQYVPYIGKKNIINLKKNYKTDIVISMTGTPTVEACLDLVRSKQVLLLFPYSGGSFFRLPEFKYIINFRTSYANEAKVLMNYAINVLRLEKFALFYQYDAYGLAGFQGALEVLKKHPSVQWKEASYLRNNPKVAAAAQSIKEFEPECVVLFAVYPIAIALLDTFGIEFLANKLIIGISALTDLFGDFLTERGLNFVLSRVVPPFNADIEIVNEYKEDMKKSSRSALTADSLEGYITSRLFCEVARAIEGGVSSSQLTKEKIIDYLSSIKNYNFKGLNLNFDPNTNELQKNIWLSTRKGWILSKEN